MRSGSEAGSRGVFIVEGVAEGSGVARYTVSYAADGRPVSVGEAVQLWQREAAVPGGPDPEPTDDEPRVRAGCRRR